MIKEVTVTKFIAFDGTEFPTREEAELHERERPTQRLSGLKPEEIEAALMRTDPDLADVFEEFGNEIAKRRRASGELRRVTKARREAMDATKSPAMKSAEGAAEDLRAAGHMV